MDRDVIADTIPEDALGDVLEFEKGLRESRARARRRRRLPTRRALAEAVAEAASLFYGHPDEFPDLVYRLLEEKGYDTGKITVKRIWSTYEELVRRRVIGDRLGVVAGREGDEFSSL